MLGIIAAQRVRCCRTREPRFGAQAGERRAMDRTGRGRRPSGPAANCSVSLETRTARAENTATATPVPEKFSSRRRRNPSPTSCRAARRSAEKRKPIELDLSGLRIGPVWVRENCRLVAGFAAEMGHPISGKKKGSGFCKASAPHGAELVTQPDAVRSQTLTA